jgi:2-hydroxychromene-2-carboxylate isomerase
VKAALREATERAGDLGVRGVPTVVVDDEAFWGDDRLDQAARAAAD